MTKLAVPQLAQPKPSAQLLRSRILIVEDDADTGLGFRIVLERTGFEVGLATSAREGLELARKTLPDLIILDLGLPDLDGYEFMEQLAASDLLSGIPKIVLSAWSPKHNEARAMESGAALYIQKPAPWEFLLESMETLLEENE